MDVDEYEHYDDPLNGDLHGVEPGKFLAFKGPQDLGGALFWTTAASARLLRHDPVGSVISLHSKVRITPVFSSQLNAHDSIV